MAANRFVVCVPARDEAERLPLLLDALAMQTVPRFVVVIALNNTTDRSREAIAAACIRNPTLEVIVDDCCFATADAHAGSARRRAMDCASDIAGEGGFILTTDADTRPPPVWVEKNLAAMKRGLDIAGGKIVIDEREPLNDAVAAARNLADRYWARVRDIEDTIDPVPWDMPPRHGDHTGASLCVSVAAYRRCGGVPVLRSGEDRALVNAVVLQGGRLGHPSEIWTRVSPRIEGRAVGGMAEHMLRLQSDCLANAPIFLPSFAQWRARAAWRRHMRARGGAVLVAELEVGLPPMIDDMVLDKAAREPAQ